MAVRTDFAAGEVLAAQDLDDTFAAKVNYALPVNAQTGSGASAYTFVLADALRLTTASNASAGTYTIPPQSSVVWLANSVIRVVNYGAGTVTIAGGAGVTVTNATTTLAQFESAALIRTASNAWTLVPFSGAGSANFSNAATGTYTDSGINYKYVTFTGSGTLTVTKAGLADVLLIGGGGGGGFNGGGGGGGGGLNYVTSFYIPVGTYTTTVGAGGASQTKGVNSSLGSLLLTFGGGRGATEEDHPNGGGGGCGGGGGSTDAGGTKNQPGGAGTFGFDGGSGRTNSSTFRNGGGGGGAGAVGVNAVEGTGAAGGAGLANSITGSSVTRAGGGGGGGNSAGSGGSGGGGNGAPSGNGSAGTANTGGGGGGGANGVGGAGGSGVVIVRVRA